MKDYAKENRLLLDYLKKNNLNSTRQRDLILKEFMSIEDHVSAEELFAMARKKDPSIGQATVFRALKVFSEAGIAEPVELSDKTVRYEHKIDHKHHDHLVCVSCGSIVEFFDERIESLQKAVCNKNGYSINRHRLDIFGVCPECRKKE